jgi:hypothetical protein
MASLGSPRPVVALMLEMSSADVLSLIATNVEVDGAGPQPSNDTGGSLRDLVMCGADISLLGSAATGDAAPASGPSSDVGLGVSGLLLPGSLGFPPSPIEWRRVEDTIEFSGHRHSEVVAQDIGLGQPEHPTFQSG